MVQMVLISAPFVAVASVVVLLNQFDAAPGIAAAVLGLVAVLIGAIFGYFADHLPELPWKRRA